MASAKRTILEVATRHFAEKGFEGAALREIMRDAGVNPAAIHYHFGSKQALYREIVTGYLKPLGDQRRAALEAALRKPAKSRRLRIMQLVRGYIEPHLKLYGDPIGRHYVRIVARFSTERRELIGELYSEYIEPMRHGYLRALAAECPDVASQDIARIFSFMVAVMVTVPLDSGREPVGARSSSPEGLIERVAEFSTAGFLHAADQDATRLSRKPMRRPDAPRAPRRGLKLLRSAADGPTT